MSIEAVCDGCGKRQPILNEVNPSSVPPLWIYISIKVAIYNPKTGRHTKKSISWKPKDYYACSPKCILIVANRATKEVGAVFSNGGSNVI